MSSPILFTIPPSNRHEFLTLDTSTKPTLKALNKLVTQTLSTSPNCAEFMGKYKASGEDAKESIQEFRVHWSGKVFDFKVWPEYTVVTEENLAAVLEMLQGEVGRGVLEVKVGKAE